MIKNITVIGDGQLARMMQTAAIELGINLHVLAGEENSSAAQVTPGVTVGDYTAAGDCLAAVSGAHAVTFDHEHVPSAVINELIDHGYSVHPRPQALIFAQDKLIQRQRLGELSMPVPEFAAINSAQDAQDFWKQVDGNVCLKACRGGYDGKGVWFPNTLEELTTLVDKLLGDSRNPGVGLLAERKVALNRELSVLVARRPSGETLTWPVTMSIQENGVCAQTITPAPGLTLELKERVEKLAVDIATKLDVTGVMAVELFAFLGSDGKEDIAVNELAMRPHNTGHWTQDGCVTSQFEQHLRAVLDLPLGQTRALEPAIVMVNVLGAQEDPAEPMADRVSKVMERFPEAKIHLYGKEYRPGRKIGHVNIAGTNLEEVRRNAIQAAGYLMRARWED